MGLAQPVARVHVVLVEPKYEGNVGSIARAMKNFGVPNLRLVRPCPIGEEARRRAMHGGDVLDAARTYRTYAAAIRGMDLVVGTSGIDTASEKKFLRIALAPRDLAARLAALDGDAALVLGREDFGLLNEELTPCDALVTIPASPEYPILNVAQAAAVLLYEVYAANPVQVRGRRKASAMERDLLHDAFADVLAVTNYPEHKRERTQVMFRRLVARAEPTTWEYHAFMGVLTRAAKTVRRERARKPASPTRTRKAAGRRG